MEKEKIDITKIIYVDMDDTICDYKTHFNLYRNKFPDNKYPQSTYKFFETIPPIKKGIEIVKKLNNIYDVWILSRPSVDNPLCYTEKRNWIEQHLGMEFCHKLILSPDKTLLKGGYLIDDVEWNFDGIQLQYGTDEYKDWNAIEKYFLTIDLREIKILLGTNQSNILLDFLIKKMKFYFTNLSAYSTDCTLDSNKIYGRKINNIIEYIYRENIMNTINISPILINFLVTSFHINYDEASDIVLFFINMYTNKNYHSIIECSPYDDMSYDDMSYDIHRNKLIKC